MACPSDATLAAHLTGQSTLGRSEDVRAHIDSCDACRELLASLARRSPRTWPSGTHPPAAPPIADHDTLIAVDPDHYVLGEPIARGGMGQIRAARDRRLGRDVAIKELLVDSDAMRQRFEREVRITAKLQHPAIVNVIEAGVWPSGEPFFAMKLIAGQSLDRAIASKATLADRLALLAGVIAATDALAYAHSLRVIHRDLKPQNILVGDFGETVVIDWGLAKDLDESAAPTGGSQPVRSATETADGAVMGTPCYMPPEQARGTAVDERADVYALGAILFHVLCGEPPHAGMSSAQIVAHLAAGGSLALDRCPAGTPRDLVAIVAKATSPVAADRYPTAKELADDLKRFHTGKLVDAQSYSRWQLVQRWVARNRRTVAVATAMLVALVAISIASVHEIVGERDLARTQRAAAERLVDFMVFQLHDRLDTVGRLDLMTGLGAAIGDYYTALRSTDMRPSDLERRAQAYDLLGDIEAKKGNSAEAKRLYGEATELGDNVWATSPELGYRITGIGYERECGLAYKVEGTTAARPWCQQALSRLSALGAAPSYADGHALPATYVQLARLAADDGHKRDALPLYEHARRLLEPLAARFPADANAQLDLADVYNNSGFAELSSGNVDGAYDLLERGVAIARKAVVADRKNARAASALAYLLTNFGAAQAIATTSTGA